MEGNERKETQGINAWRGVCRRDGKWEEVGEGEYVEGMGNGEKVGRGEYVGGMDKVGGGEYV